MDYKLILSPKPERICPPKWVCMHLTLIPTCMNFLSQFRSTKFLDDHGNTCRCGAHALADIRTPLYFTVPLGSAGKHRWIAKMGEQETSVNTPVTINV